jgi:ribosomal protection tetracycline resistance protein
MTECGYSSPGTTAADYRKLAPLVLMSALKEAATEVCEPINRFRVDGPADSLQPTLRLLAQLRAEPHVPTIFDSSFVLEGDIPAARLHLLQQQIQAATRGEGVLEFRFERYQPVADSIPTRARSDNNPLNREEYLLHVVRRVAGP